MSEVVKLPSKQKNYHNDMLGDIRSYIYFDMDLTRESSNGTPLTLSCISGIGTSFYAEFTDYDPVQITSTIINATIKNMRHPEYKTDGAHWELTGTRKEIGDALLLWFADMFDEVQFFEEVDPVNYLFQFVSYNNHFKFNILINEIIAPALKKETVFKISTICFELGQELLFMVNTSNYAATQIEEAHEEDVNALKDVVLNPRRGYDFIKEVASEYNNSEDEPDFIPEIADLYYYSGSMNRALAYLSIMSYLCDIKY